MNLKNMSIFIERNKSGYAICFKKDGLAVSTIIVGTANPNTANAVIHFRKNQSSFESHYDLTMEIVDYAKNAAIFIGHYEDAEKEGRILNFIKYDSFEMARFYDVNGEELD